MSERIVITLPDGHETWPTTSMQAVFREIEKIGGRVDHWDGNVYAVRPGDMSEGLAVFEREQDAESFRSTFEHVGDVERCYVADQQTAHEMWVERREGEDVEDEAKERATCSTCLARTYRQEECVCEGEKGDAEDYDEVLAELTSKGEETT